MAEKVACNDILLAADDPVHWEMPLEFDRDAAIAAVVRVQPDLERMLGEPLELDDHVEDAAYFAELAARIAPRDVAGFGKVTLTRIAVRFSAFGRLVTVWGNVPEAPLREATIAPLVACLGAAGYQYVPLEVLETPYTGSNRFAEQIDTWWLRFFDYC